MFPSRRSEPYGRHDVSDAKSKYLVAVLVSLLGSANSVSGQNLRSIAGAYRRLPVENDWHAGSIEIVEQNGNVKLRWKNKAGVSWNLIPASENGILETDTTNPYYNSGQREFRLKMRDGKVIGFQFQNDLFVRDGIKIVPQLSGGFHGYISMSTEKPPAGIRIRRKFLRHRLALDR